MVLKTAMVHQSQLNRNTHIILDVFNQEAASQLAPDCLIDNQLHKLQGFIRYISIQYQLPRVQEVLPYFSDSHDLTPVLSLMLHKMVDHPLWSDLVVRKAAHTPKFIICDT